MRYAKALLKLSLAWGLALAPLQAGYAETYAYDALGRLVVVSTDDSKRATYAYDGPGNRTASAGAAGTLQAPLVVDDPRSYSYGSPPLVFDPRVNDVDPAGLPLTIVGVSPPAYGAASFTSGAVTYTAPSTHISQTDFFAYTIQNSAGQVGSGFVTVALSNAQPVANPDAVSTPQNQPITFDPRSNDSDPGGNTLSITGVTAPAHGTASFTPTSVTYTPATTYVGSDSFGYSISNGVGGVASSTISVTVTPSGAPLSVSLSAIAWNWSQVSTGPIHVSPPVVATPSGGVPPYTFTWGYVSGDTGIFVVPGAGGGSATWGRSMPTYDTWTARWRVTVTDAAANSVSSPEINVRFIRDSGS